ncbi:MAG: glycosyltransferase family 4 protein [Bacteroidota bacterium]|nr:glycosyltransferase family 4 protein [Bacteroidota bacterium]
MRYRRAKIKIRLELVGMFPFVLLGRIYGRLFPLRAPGNLFLFFASADLGGAIKVNADILDCVADRQPVIIFSKRPRNNGFRSLFYRKGVTILDLHKRIDNKLFHFVNFFYRGVLASWINRAKDPVVFGGENLFFYKVIPHLRADIPRIELCHLDTWLPYTIGLIDRITMRICSTLRMKEAIIRQYDENRVEPKYYDRLHFIENRIDMPEFEEVSNPKLEVVFIGRGAPQKRVPLIAAIATRMHELGLPVHFSFVGDVEKVIEPGVLPFCTFYGNVRDEERMRAIYRGSDVLILTSAYEGLPLVVMIMMAHGKVVISTAVNGIPDYITHLENGLLIRATGEEEIVEEGVALLRLLIEDPALRIAMGRQSRAAAMEKFGGALFCREYRRILIR